VYPYKLIGQKSTNRILAKNRLKMDMAQLMRSMQGGGDQMKIKEQKPFSELRFKEKITRIVQNSAGKLNSFKWLPFLFFPFVLSMGLRELGSDTPPPGLEDQVPTTLQKVMHVVLTLVPFPFH
jgi:hypothetical protein